MTLDPLQAQPGPSVGFGETRGPWFEGVDDETWALHMFALHHQEIRWRVYPRVIALSNPAAGADWQTAVPEGTLWRIFAVTATLVTSATAANRGVFLAAGDGTTTPVNSWIGTNIAASTTVKLGWLRGGAAVASGAAVAGIGVAPLVPLPGGFVVQSSTTSLQAGDQWSNISLYVLEVQQRQVNEQIQVARSIIAGEHSDQYPSILEEF